MKIKLSRSKWEDMGKKAGWMKESESYPPEEVNEATGVANGDYAERMIQVFRDTFSGQPVSIVKSEMYEDGDLVASLTLSNGVSLQLKLNNDLKDAGTFDISG